MPEFPGRRRRSAKDRQGIPVGSPAVCQQGTAPYRKTVAHWGRSREIRPKGYRRGPKQSRASVWKAATHNEMGSCCGREPALDAGVASSARHPDQTVASGLRRPRLR
jgi:hypothetical protein